MHKFTVFPFYVFPFILLASVVKYVIQSYPPPWAISSILGLADTEICRSFVASFKRFWQTRAATHVTRHTLQRRSNEAEAVTRFGFCNECHHITSTSLPMKNLLVLALHTVLSIRSFRPISKTNLFSVCLFIFNHVEAVKDKETSGTFSLLLLAVPVKDISTFQYINMFRSTKHYL